MIFGILGGDFRYKFLYDMLKEKNLKIKVYNNKFIEKDNVLSLDEFLSSIDILITPIPFTKDNKTIFNLNDEVLEIKTLEAKIINSDIKFVCGGLLDKTFTKNLEAKNINTLDFMEKEEVAILNAIPTAEGAIQAAMENSHKTLFSSKCLVLGYGRCGKILANMLKGIGANVSATYRKEEDFAYIKGFGIEALDFSNLKKYAKDFDFIFNTIPSKVFDEPILKTLNENSIIIDLAQAPGGVDYNIARDLNIKAIYCPSLPSRVAPYTAGEILKDCILNYCDINNK